MGDGHYQVRRAAYRGLQWTAAPLLQQWCWTWAASAGRSLRLRAAEASAWLLPDGEQGKTYVTLYDRLATDPEPEVRQAAQRMRQERRKRLWAEAYLTHMLQVLQDGTHSNADMLAAWPYMESVKRVGDDTMIRTARMALRNPDLPPHLRQCYLLLLKETSRGGRKQ